MALRKASPLNRSLMPGRRPDGRMANVERAVREDPGLWQATTGEQRPGSKRLEPNLVRRSVARKAQR